MLTLTEEEEGGTLSFTLLHSPPGSSSTSTPGTSAHPKPSNLDYLHTVPLIFRDAHPKFKNVKQVMSELSQYHLELRVSRVKDVPNRGLFVIGNTPQEVLVLQSEKKSSHYMFSPAETFRSGLGKPEEMIISRLILSET